MDRYSGNKTQILYRCCSNYSLIVGKGLRICGERRTQIPLSSSAMKGLLERIQDTKSNHIMVSFTDHYNAISIARLPSKTKIGKSLWCFSSFSLCKPEFSSTTISF